MESNTTEYNIAFHADYKSGLEEGLRCPIDDSGVRSTGDRPFALGSHELEWKLGSANRAVKHIADYYGYTISANDLANYNGGTMQIHQLRKYVNKRMLYGYKGYNRNSMPKDLMSFRGYPTYDIESIEYTNIELNKSTSLTNTMGGQITATSNLFTGQVLTSSLPVGVLNDYIIWEGKVILKEEFPMDKIYIRLAQETAIENSLAEFDNMFLGTYFDNGFGEKTECINSGDNKTFYFRMSAEISGSDIPNDGTVYIKFDNNKVDPYVGDAWYGFPIIQTSLYTLINVTWDGTRWVGDSAFTYDTEAPTTPANLLITEGSGTITLSADTAFDNVGVKGYRFYVKEQGHRTWDVYDVQTPNVIVTVKGETYYEIYVTAYDESGNESIPSDVQSITTAVSTLLQICYIGDTSYTDASGACIGALISSPLYCENPQGLLDGTDLCRLYLDSEGLTPFTGLYRWWKFAKYQHQYPVSTILISDNGDVFGYNPCDTSP